MDFHVNTIQLAGLQDVGELTLIWRKSLAQVSVEICRHCQQNRGSARLSGMLHL